MEENHDDLIAELAELGLPNSQGEGFSVLIPQMYQELHGIADSYLRGENHQQSFGATSLVHEAYVRMAACNGVAFNDRAHFFRLAARIMRRILIDHARSRSAEKRGGGAQPITMIDTAEPIDNHRAEILEIDEAIRQLSTLNMEKAQVVELRYYGGCTIEETAEAMGISTATVERHWRFARAWLKSQLLNED